MNSWNLHSVSDDFLTFISSFFSGEMVQLVLWNYFIIKQALCICKPYATTRSEVEYPIDFPTFLNLRFWGDLILYLEKKTMNYRRCPLKHKKQPLPQINEDSCPTDAIPGQLQPATQRQYHDQPRQPVDWPCHSGLHLKSIETVWRQSKKS